MWLALLSLVQRNQLRLVTTNLKHWRKRLKSCLQEKTVWTLKLCWNRFGSKQTTFPWTWMVVWRSKNRGRPSRCSTRICFLRARTSLLTFLWSISKPAELTCSSKPINLTLLVLRLNWVRPSWTTVCWSRSFRSYLVGQRPWWKLQIWGWSLGLMKNQWSLPLILSIGGPSKESTPNSSRSLIGMPWVGSVAATFFKGNVFVSVVLFIATISQKVVVRPERILKTSSSWRMPLPSLLIPARLKVSSLKLLTIFAASTWTCPGCRRSQSDLLFACTSQYFKL